MTNQIKPTHETLDHEEARLIMMLQQAARFSPPNVYGQTKATCARRFDAIDKLRAELLGKPK